MSEYTYREAILWNFLSDAPEGWDYDKIIDKLYSDDFYRSYDDPECPDDESLDIWEFYVDWDTQFLAKHIMAIVEAVGKTLNKENTDDKD